MSVPFGYYCSAGNGIYFTSAFTLSGAITWSSVTNTGLFDDSHDCFAVDPFSPLNRQYVFCAGAGYGGALAPREVYTRNGGSWTKILDIQQVEAISGVPIVNGVSRLQTIWCDPTVEGSIYAGYSPQGGAPKHLMKSLDYGANWTSIEVPLTDLTNLWEFKVYGDSIWVQNGRDTLQHSPNVGANWYQAVSVGQSLASGVCVNPTDTTEAYMATWSGYDLEYHKYAAGAVTKTTKQAGSSLANAVALGNVGTMETMWIDQTDGDHQRIVKSDGILYYTYDKWTNKTETLTDIGASPRHLTHIQGSSGTEADIVAIAGGTVQVIIYDDEDDTTGTDRSGVGGGAVVGDAARYGLWVGYAPVKSGVHVFSVEEDDITDIYYHDGLGIPMFGDRSSWRDYDADDDGTATATPLSYYHAEDIRDEQPQRHNPWPAASGTAPVSDGSKWVATDIITQTEFDYSFYIGGGTVPTTVVNTLTAGTYTLNNTYDVVLCNCAGGAITLNLPAAATNTGRKYTVKKIDATANEVTINPNALETIDDDTTLILDSQYSSAQIVCDGTEWWIV